MLAVAFAFSVSHFVSTVGADAGFAAIVGLALLALLYFAQARESALLREEVAEAADRVQQIEQRMAALARGAAAPAQRAPAPAPPGVARPAVAAARTGPGAPAASRGFEPGAAVAAAPSAPAGVGAPALSAATRLIPGPDRDPIAVRANGRSTAPPDVRGAAGREGDAAVLSPAGPPMGPRPATAAGGANGAGNGASASASSPSAAAARKPAPARTPTPARTSAPARSLRRPATGPPRRGGAMTPGRLPAGGSRRPRWLTLLLGLVALGAVVALVLALTSGGGSGATPSTAASPTAVGQRTRHHTSRAVPAIKPASVTVAVLNGTSVANLAHATAARLAGAGFNTPTILTGADQTLTATTIGYLPGYRPDALVVAQYLKLSNASVKPVDQSGQTLACPAASTPCPAQVVVTVGSDLASNT